MLLYRGYSVAELADQGDFMDAAYLLLQVVVVAGACWLAVGHRLSLLCWRRESCQTRRRSRLSRRHDTNLPDLHSGAL